MPLEEKLREYIYYDSVNDVFNYDYETVADSIKAALKAENHNEDIKVCSIEMKKVDENEFIVIVDLDGTIDDCLSSWTMEIPVKF